MEVKTKRYKKSIMIYQVFQGQRQGGQSFRHVGLQDTAKIGRHVDTTARLRLHQIGVDLLHKGLMDTDQNRGTLEIPHLDDFQQPTFPWLHLSLSRRVLSTHIYIYIHTMYVKASPQSWNYIQWGGGWGGMLTIM